MKLIECPRDAMQGMTEFISTDRKVDYINQLLRVGFDTIDFGSFVSPKAIPQMRDTADVLRQLNLTTKRSRLLAIVANERGAQDALQFPEIDFLGFPLSLSETFQQRNTNRSIKEALATVDWINTACAQHNRQLVVYLSMGFGNPYGDPFSDDVIVRQVNDLVARGVSIVSISDTVGVATPTQIHEVLKGLLSAFPQLEFGAHLHAKPSTALANLTAALSAGCRRLDSAMLGFGGCPMADDHLIGNVSTDVVIQLLKEKNLLPESINIAELETARAMAQQIFS